MTINIFISDTERMFSADISDGATVYEAMEAISNLLLSTNYNYIGIVNAHLIEAERMRDAIKEDEE